ncbi:MAG: hypothetical protein KJ023_00295 [Burkholderiaceae bacterium]|nr:hypothetical protein [Burkholderiaceae bacterium]
MPTPHNGAAGRTPIDFASLARALLDRAEHFLSLWLPGGRIDGHEYLGPSKKHGGIGDSLKVNLRTGVWAFFGGADTDSGGDLISLYAWLEGKKQHQAALELMEDLGWIRADDEGPQASASPPERAAGAPASTEPPPVPRTATRWKSVLPVPKHAPVPKRFVWRYHDRVRDGWVELEAVKAWEYAFEAERFGFVCRFERLTSDGEIKKETLPYTWCEDTQDPNGAHRWNWKQWQEPRPLYVPATLLSGDPARVPVVIVEGEKCAMAGHELLGHEFDFVSWPGGAKAWALARWGWLMGRTVYLWPDADAKRQALTRAEREADVDPNTKPLLPLARQPGFKAMAGIGALLQAEHGCTVLMCPMQRPGEQPDGWDIADAIAGGWTADQVRDYIRSARAFEAPDEAVRAAAGDPAAPGRAAAAAGRSTPTKAPAGDGGGSDSGDEAAWGWRAHLMTAAKSGATLAVRENVVLALDGRPDKGVPGIPECAGLLRFNEFTSNIEKARPTPWGTPAGDFLEADELLMGDWLVREQFMPSFARQVLEEAVIVVARRHVHHPARERFIGLRGKWDGENRLDTWLRRVCLEEDEWDEADPLQQYLMRVGRWFLMGMVARVLPEVREGARQLQGPGTKFDTMLVLESPQGWGKSSLAKLLGGDYYADTGLDLQNKDSLMNIQGVLVYEWSELQDLSRHEVGAVKRFISSPVDRFRATFDRRPAKYPRQVVFVGTTNDAHYLTDTTGNRRFWPVRVTRPPDLAWLEANLEQMLAEAVHRVEARERFWPTMQEQRDLFTPQQQARTIESALDSAIRGYLYDEHQKVPLGRENGSLVNRITMQALLTAIGYSIDKQTDAVVKKAGAVMHALGWEVKRTSEPGRPRCYVRPPEARPRAEPGGSDGSRPAQGAAATEDADAIPF